MSKIGTLVLETYYDDMGEASNETQTERATSTNILNNGNSRPDLSVDSRLYADVQQAAHTRKHKSLVGAK